MNLRSRVYGNAAGGYRAVEFDNVFLDNTDHWYEYLYDNTAGAQFNSNIITLNILDGARGDDDLTANGTVLDIGDSGRTVTTDGDDSGGGGCFISILN